MQCLAVGCPGLVQGSVCPVGVCTGMFGCAETANQPDTQVLGVRVMIHPLCLCMQPVCSSSLAIFKYLHGCISKGVTAKPPPAVSSLFLG